MASPAEAITRHYGGDWHGRYGTIPTPGHRKRDRGTRVRDGDNGDVIFDSFNGGDWREIKDECRRLGLLPDRGESHLSPADRRTLDRQRREAAERRRREQAELQEAAAVEALRLWAAAGPAEQAHPYLARKGITGEGLRQTGRDLLVPMHDIAGRLWNLQRIRPNGFKLFLKGARVEGLFSLIGRVEHRLCLGEGVATMKAVRAATGYPVVIAFTAANLERVAKALRQRCPAADIIVCADDDPHLLANPRVRKNVGLEAAKAAAAAIGGRLAVPTQGAA